MEHEFLSEAQIKERYPEEWVLVRNAEFDDKWNVVRGVVAAHSPNREVIDEAQANLVTDDTTGNMARLCFKKLPRNTVVLL